MKELFYSISQWFLMVTSLYATIYGLIYRYRFKEMRFLFIYPAASFIETFLSPTINVKFPRISEKGIPEMLVNMFLLIEFIVLYHYFLQLIPKTKVRNFLYFIFVTYVSVMILIWFTKNTFYTNPQIFYVPQAILVLIPGLYYFFDLINAPIRIELRAEPSFWVTIGIMLYFACTLPLFLLNNVLDYSNVVEKKVYAINSYSYGLLYLLLIKAFLCTKRKAQL